MRLADTTGESTFNFERGIENLDSALERIRNVRLLVVDPLSAYMGKVDTHRDAETRRVLAPLADLASRRRLGVIGIMHLKKSETSALLRLSLLRVPCGYLGEDPNAPGNHVMVPAKSNLAAKQAGLAYRIEPDARTRAPRIFWQDGPVTLDANEVVTNDPREKNGGRGDRKEAAEWLQAQLSDGHSWRIFKAERGAQSPPSRARGSKSGRSFVAMSQKPCCRSRRNYLISRTQSWRKMPLKKHLLSSAGGKRVTRWRVQQNS